MFRKLSRRDFLRLAGIATSSAALAACAPQPAPVATQPPAAGAPAPTAAPAAAKKVKIEFMNWWGAQRRPLMDQVITDFMAANPNIEVTNQETPWDNRDQVAATAMASSTPPAVMMSTRVETYKYAKEGLIIPIDDYVKAAGVDVNKLFYPGEINNQRWNGKLWTMPMPTGGGNSSLYIYSKALFKAAGLDPEKPPKTWQELDDVAAKVLKKKGNAIEVMGVDPVGGTAAGATTLIYWLVFNNGNLATEDARTLTINTPEAVETLEWLVEFTNKHHGGWSNCIDFWTGNNDTAPDGRFYKDRLGIWWVNVSAFSHLKTQAPDKHKDPQNGWGVALRPYNGKNAKATHHGETGLAFAWGQVIPKAIAKEKQDAAYKFVEFLSTNNKGVCAFLFAQDRPAPLISCNANPDYKKNNPYWDIVLKALETDMSLPITPVQTEISSFMKEAVEKALLATAKPKAALDEAASKGQAVLDKYWKGA